MKTNRKLTYISIGVVLTGFFISFFFDPIKIQPVQILSPEEELTKAEFSGVSDPQFGDTVVNSTWAMVLTHSEFSRENAGGLEALRNWAKQRLISDRQFLNPLNLPQTRSTRTVFDSFTNSFLGLPFRVIESGTAFFLRWRLGEFQETSAYQSFRVNYYELFGISQESAKLLFRYQEERAKESISVLLSAAFWICSVVFLICQYLFKQDSLENILSLFWYTLAAFYLYLSMSLDSVVVLVGAIGSLALGIYLRYGPRLSVQENKSIRIEKGAFSSGALTFVLWATVSLVFLQIINWIKGGILTGPDPLTLLIGGVTGNFLHDPVGIKRSVLEISGAIWLIFSLVTMYRYKRGRERSREVESELRQFGRQKVSIQ